MQYWLKKPIGKRLYSSFNLCSNGILSDSTHIRSIISISLIPWRSPLKCLSRCTPTWQLFSVVISKVMTSHENTLYDTSHSLWISCNTQQVNRISGAVYCNWSKDCGLPRLKNEEITTLSYMIPAAAVMLFSFPDLLHLFTAQFALAANWRVKK